MSMSDRVARLRQQSLDAIPTLSPERAELMTRFYQQQTEKLSVPVEQRTVLNARSMAQEMRLYQGTSMTQSISIPMGKSLWRCSGRPCLSISSGSWCSVSTLSLNPCGKRKLSLFPRPLPRQTRKWLQFGWRNDSAFGV